MIPTRLADVASALFIALVIAAGIAMCVVLLTTVPEGRAADTLSCGTLAAPTCWFAVEITDSRHPSPRDVLKITQTPAVSTPDAEMRVSRLCSAKVDPVCASRLYSGRSIRTPRSAVELAPPLPGTVGGR